MSKLVEFQIHKLWGEKNVILYFDENRLILVGENGSGKSTILRILYETLACKFILLSAEDFEYITITFETDSITIRKSELPEHDAFFEFDPSLFNDMPPQIRIRVMDYSESIGHKLSYADVISIFKDFGYTNNRAYKAIIEKMGDLEDSHVAKLTAKIRECLGCNIIYLPTYRRAEKRVGYASEQRMKRNRTFRRQMLERNDDTAIEIYRTGMDDVEEYIQANIDWIREKADLSSSRLNYQCFKGILKKESDSVQYDQEILSKENIEDVFGSINEKVLSAEESEQIKEQLIAMDAPGHQTYEQIVYYYYSALYKRYKEIKNDEKIIINFFNACNKYLVNKKFVYNEKEYSYSIHVIDNNSGRELKLEDLSSGEKQVVSIFSYLYLSPFSKSIVLIDEPELSLSVPWQKRFLADISNGTQCVGLVSVTHSPFVYDNELKQFAHALEEFIK